MEKNIISEINRVKEIMGLEVLLEQSRKVVRTLPDVDVLVGNSMTPITFPDNIVLPIAKGNEGVTDVSKITFKNLLPDLKDFIIKLKKNLAVDYTPESISIDSGASPTPANRAVPKGYSQEQVDFSYGNEEPDNKILARKRGEVILELLNKFIPRQWGGQYSNLDQDKVNENWKELSALVKANPQTNSTKFVAINVVGTKKVKGRAIYGCGKKLNVSGEQGDKNNNWIATLKPQEKSEVKLDKEGNLNLGKYTEGKITLQFDPKVVPDAFKVTYDGKVSYVPFTSNTPEKMDDPFVIAPTGETDKDGNETKVKINLSSLRKQVENHLAAQQKIEEIEKRLISTVSQEVKDELQKLRSQYGKKINKPLNVFHFCRLKDIDGEVFQMTNREWFKKYFGWSEAMTNYAYKKANELGFDIECGEYNQWKDVRAKVMGKISSNEFFKKAQKSKLISYNKEKNVYELDEEKIKELGGGSYNQQLERAAQDASDPEIKKLLLQGVVGKPQSVTINKVYGKPNVKIEAIAPLGGTYYTIGLKCESEDKTS